MHVLAQILPMDARLQFPYQRSFTDNFAAESVAALSQQSTGVDQGIKTFFADQTANGKNKRRRLELRWLKLGAVSQVFRAIRVKFFASALANWSPPHLQGGQKRRPPATDALSR